MAKNRTLSVYPNPFHALDHNGRPACVLPYEPEGDGVTTFDDRRFVGAQLNADIVQKFPQGDPRHTIQVTSFVFTDEPITVRDSHYYKSAIRRGELIAADEETAKQAGKTFVDPKIALENERKGALAWWTQQAHEEHDTGHPDELASFSFGPMEEAVKLRSKKKAEENKPSVETKMSRKAPEGGV